MLRPETHETAKAGTSTVAINPNTDERAVRMNMGYSTMKNQSLGFEQVRDAHHATDMQTARLSGLISALFTLATDHPALGTSARENVGIMSLLDVIEESANLLRELAEAEWAAIVALGKAA